MKFYKISIILQNQSSPLAYCPLKNIERAEQTTLIEGTVSFCYFLRWLIQCKKIKITPFKILSLKASSYLIGQDDF